MKSRNIQNYILYILLDSKKHTISEIAERVEISYSTAQRHISELSLLYPILTFVGGRDSGGVQLKQSYKFYENFFSKNELQLILEGLILLQKDGKDTTDLIERLSPNSELKQTSHADTPAITSERSNKKWVNLKIF